MNAVWSNEQKRCLDALGYTMYRYATVSKADGTQQMATSTAATARDPLLLGLLRAAHCDLARITDPGDWLRTQQIQSLTQLRNDPAAKRALWPRLRALRSARTSP
jgi:hypothetical protein